MASAKAKLSQGERERLDRNPSDKQTHEALGLAEWINISLWPAATALYCQLCGDKFPNTAPRLYDRFLSYIEKYPSKGTTAERQLTISRLYLSHPVSFRADYAISFLKSHFEGKSTKEIRDFLPSNRGLCVAFGWAFKVAADVAKQKGDLADAAWLEATYRQHQVLRPMGYAERPRRSPTSEHDRAQDSKPPSSRLP